MFKFRLKRVLDFISKDELAKKMDLAIAKKQVAETRSKIANAQGEIRSLLEDPEKISVVWLQYIGERSHFQLDEIKRLETELDAQKQEEAGKAKILSVTAAKRRGLELLRDKRQSEYRLNQRRKEQIQQDEVYQILKAGKE